MIKLSRTVYATLLLPALAACGPDIARRTAGMEIYRSIDSQQEKIDVGDPDVARRIEHVQTLTRDEGGILHVQSQLRNLSADTWHGEYQFVFYDEKGWDLTGSSAVWISLAVNGRETATLNGVCPAPGARAYRLKIRSDKPIRQ